MNDAVTVIDIVAQVTDATEVGTNSAQRNISRLEKSIMQLQSQIQSMRGKSKLEVIAMLKDMASQGIQGVLNAGKKLAGKVWTVTLKAVDMVSAPFRKVIGLLTNPITQVAAFAGITFGLADTINTFKDFEQGMANVKAISGATEEEFAALETTARQLGESTMFSAAQAAEAMENLAMAGWKSDDIIAGMPGLLDLAAAGSVDLATAADVVSSALAQFNMGADEAARVADVLAVVATNSKTDVAGLGESLKMAGTQAGALGYSIEDAALALGLMGNAGIDASSAGTALRTTLARMSKQEGLTAEESNAMAKAMRRVGVSLTDETGKSKSLLEVMQELRAGFKGMTETEKAATAANLAGMYAQSGLLAIVNASDEKFNALAAALEHVEGAAAGMAAVKMDTLQGALYYLQSAAEGVKIAIGKKLEPYVKGLVKWITAHMPDIQAAVEKAVDFVSGKIDEVLAAITELTASPEWQKAERLWEKIKLAWDRIIVEPFAEWWNGTGRAWLAGLAESVGRGMGTALHDGIIGILGIDVDSVAKDGVSIGATFAKSFMEGFKAREVAEAIVAAIKNAFKGLVLDAGTLLPGGEKASGTSGISAAILGYGAFKTMGIGKKLFAGGRTLLEGGRTLSGGLHAAQEGAELARAAQTGGAGFRAAAAMAEAGELGVGAQLGAQFGGEAGRAASFATKAAVPLAALTSVLTLGADAYAGAGKAQEWTGSDSTASKIVSGVGAMLGGTGSGILGDESVGRKVLEVGGGALKGAGIGAAVGSFVPVVGTAVGGAVGAGAGTIGAAIGGENIAKALADIGGAIKGFFMESIPGALGKVKEEVSVFFMETLPVKFAEFKEGVASVFMEKIPYIIGYVAGEMTMFFTESIPQKFAELKTGISEFFTQGVPNAIMTAGTTVNDFFMVMVPMFFNNLWRGVAEFFTETLPQSLENMGETLKTFLCESVPNKITELWDGILNFFTQSIPSTISSISEGISGFFESIKEKVAEVFSGLQEKISGFFTGIWAKVTGNVSAGYSGAMAAHAEGGIMTTPHIGLVAEDGAEAIIPLSGKRRERGISLWEKAGRILGVKPYAEGDIVGLNEMSEPKAIELGTSDWSETVGETAKQGEVGIMPQVTIQNLTFAINVDGGSAQDAQALLETIKENVRGMTDEIAYQLAIAMQQAYANMPTAVW